MFETGFILRTTREFQTAILYRSEIEVRQKGERFHGRGKVDAFNSATVTVNGNKFPRVTCEFIVRSD